MTKLECPKNFEARSSKDSRQFDIRLSTFVLL